MSVALRGATPSARPSRTRSVVALRRAPLRAAAAAGSAAQTIDAAGSAFRDKRPAEAVLLYSQALELAPSEDERCAALYNRACALTALARFEEAGEDLRAAYAPRRALPCHGDGDDLATHARRSRSVNDHRVKYSVAAADSDLAALRAWRGYPELAASLSGSGGERGVRPGAATAKLRAEAKSPFRLLRLFAAGGLGAGAGIASLFTLPALLAAAARVSGGDADAVNALTASAGNAAVNAGVLAAAALAVRAELAAKASAEVVALAEEALAALRVAPPAGGSASLSLAQLRGARAPLLLVGSKPHLRGAARAAEPLRRELVKRGVLLCVLQDDSSDGATAASASAADALRAGSPRGFGPAAASAASVEPGAAAGSGDAFAPNEPGREWRVALADVPAWREWATARRVSMGLQAGSPFYVALDVDGSVRRAEAGAPDWEVIVDESPLLPATK